MKKISIVYLGLFLFIACSSSSSTTAPTFYGGNDESINATMQASGTVTSDGRTVTVKVYVDDKMASANATAAAQALCSKFIGDGASNSIYGWITNIFGAEWGSLASQSYPGDFISDNKTISILLYDIDGDQYTNLSGPWTVGFFWARDNFLQSSHDDPETDYSNETIMFYIDLPYFLRVAASKGETSWSANGYYPKVIYSTLAHEFQHMIHFYQKDIVYNSDSDTWFNEMCSVTAEDFVADKLGVEGPRGVLDVNLAAASGTTDGRLPLFNYDNVHSLTTWGSDLDSYATVYAFGAYLSRNQGGAQLFGKLVQSATPMLSSYPYTTYDTQALTNAITAVGGSETVESLLRQWGAAVVLSSSSSGLPTTSKVQYNTGTALTTVSGSVTYNLGPINLYNYTYSSLNHPFFGSIAAAASSVLSYMGSLSPSAVSEVPSLPGKHEITESNRKLASHLSKNQSRANKLAIQKNISVPKPSASITTNPLSSWSPAAANTVSYFASSVTSPLTITPASSLDICLVFSNLNTTTAAKPTVQVDGGSVKTVTLNSLYTSMQPVSNAYYDLGTLSAVAHTVTLTVPSGVVVTAVAK